MLWNILQRVSILVLPKPSFRVSNLSGIQILFSHSLPLLPLLIFSPFSASVFLSPTFPSSISLHVICRRQKEMPQCFWNPLLTDRDIWLGRRHTGRKGKHGCWNALLTSPLSFFYSFIPFIPLMCLPGLPITDIREGELTEGFYLPPPMISPSFSPTQWKCKPCFHLSSS